MIFEILQQKFEQALPFIFGNEHGQFDSFSNSGNNLKDLPKLHQLHHNQKLAKSFAENSTSPLSLCYVPIVILREFFKTFSGSYF